MRFRQRSNDAPSNEGYGAYNIHLKFTHVALALEPALEGGFIFMPAAAAS
jgi:hypothetical protein